MLQYNKFPELRLPNKCDIRPSMCMVTVAQWLAGPQSREGSAQLASPRRPSHEVRVIVVLELGILYAMYKNVGRGSC